MKRLMAFSFVTLMAALAAAPAQGQPSRKTELVELGGKSVDRLQLRHDVDAVWVVDNQNILYRDTLNEHYLVTLKQACQALGVRSRGFNFRPENSWQLLATRAYQVRPQAGPRCDVAKVERVDDARADALSEASLRRVW